jgi:putative component of toxin-antitoxin plasmid stabilization module
MLGEVDEEFEAWMKDFKEMRQQEEVELRERLECIVLGKTGRVRAEKKKEEQTGVSEVASEEGYGWDWRYSLRTCTAPSCVSQPYSPFSIYLFAFYITPRTSGFVPLATLCPTCAEKEVEAFEHRVTRAGRCGQDETNQGSDDKEWDAWFDNAVMEREAQRMCSEGVQEKSVREKKGAVIVEKGEKKQKKRRDSMLKRMFNKW